MNILITGASRGIGLEFTRQYLAQSHHVLASCREPHNASLLQALDSSNGKLDIIQMEVTDALSLAQTHATISGLVDGLDLLINNAGIFPPNEDTLDGFDADIMRRAFDVNSVAPLAVTKCFLELLKRGSNSKIANISSGCGSMETVRDILQLGSYSYKCSKAALNMITILLANELKPDGIAVCSLQPGWVRTDMTSPVADLTPEESISGMIKVIAALTLENTGSFTNFDGKAHVW